MALPPTIPTSFVPHQPVASAPKKRTSAVNPFLALSYLVLAVAVLGAGGVFGYKLFLEGIAKKKADDVARAQQQVDQATVLQFVRLRDRFAEAKNILDRHVAVSEFLNALEDLTLQGVTFNSLQVSVKEDRTAEITLSGTARSFNTLAAQSSVVAKDTRFKRAIFSGIGNQGNLVKFELKSEVDPSLVLAKAPTGAPEPAPVETTTASSSAPTTP